MKHKNSMLSKVSAISEVAENRVDKTTNGFDKPNISDNKSFQDIEVGLQPIEQNNNDYNSVYDTSDTSDGSKIHKKRKKGTTNNQKKQSSPLDKVKNNKNDDLITDDNEPDIVVSEPDTTFVPLSHNEDDALKDAINIEPFSVDSNTNDEGFEKDSESANKSNANQQRFKRKRSKTNPLDKVNSYKSPIQNQHDVSQVELSEDTQETKKRPSEKAADINNNMEYSEPKTEALSYDGQINLEEIVTAKREKRRDIQIKWVRHIATVLIIAGCVYLLFLIYGVFNTTYIYDDNGNIVPQKMSVESIRELDEYKKFEVQYLQARIIYEKVLTLDYRIAAGVEESMVVAPEYESVLDDVEALSIQLQALEVPAKYSQLKVMLSAWVQTDVAVYCQRMSEAISQNNAQYAQQALEYRQIMYNDFSLITENLVIIGETVDGADLETIVNWSPESYVRENIGAIN